MSRLSEEIPFTIRYSRRKTVGLSLLADGGVLVRAPQWMDERQVRAFLDRHERWFSAGVRRLRERQAEAAPGGRLSGEQIQALSVQAGQVIPARVAHYAPLIGVTCGRITIRCQKTRWGSCSAKGNLNFNCLLMLMPLEVIDYVVVHELAHRIEMNHSQRFWKIVESVLPDWRQRRRLLHENEARVMQMRP